MEWHKKKSRFIAKRKYLEKKKKRLQLLGVCKPALITLKLATSFC
jgi:hypothetical protein